jgi:hypothetical protein
MAAFDAYRSAAELRKLYLHCQYLAQGSSRLQVYQKQSGRVAAAFLRAAQEIPTFGNAGKRRRLLESVARLALAIWHGVQGGRDTVLLFIDCLLGTANYQLPADDRDQAVRELRAALDGGSVSAVASVLRLWK